MLSAGIVGLPNVGKSTLFNAVTRTHKAPAENYPFCTIDPNVGVVTVPDFRLGKIAEISRSKKITPTAIEFVDIAGLVKGASAGEGLGNQFLHHIREVEAIVQVVRCFENPDVHHVSATIDPIRDIEVINTELVLADLASLQKRRERLQKQLHAGEKSAMIETEVIEKLVAHLDRGKPAITATLTPEERSIVRGFFLLSSKPTIFACNVAESDLAAVAGIGDTDRNKAPQSYESGITDPGYSAAKRVGAVQDYARHHFATEAIVISAQIESELVDLTEQEALEYLRGLGVEDSGVHALIRAVYHLLGLRTFFTAGEKETRAWTIHAGEKAPAAAGVVTFMWQPVQTPCSTATIAASPLLLKRRSNWSSKSASILDASASRSFSSSRCCVSSAFDLLSRSINCREIVSLVARAVFCAASNSAFILSASIINSSS